MLRTVECAPDEPTPPPRKFPTPATAAWAGGLDGGRWFDCRGIAGLMRSTCSIYADWTGELEVQGDFVLCAEDCSSGTCKLVPPRGPVASLDFASSFDSYQIPLEESLDRSADGVLNFPFGDGHGKHQRYAAGVEVGEEISY